MNKDVTRTLSSISVPTKQMLLAVLRIQSGLTIPDICSTIFSETSGEISYHPAILRYAAKQTLQRNTIVKSSTLNERKRPLFWELTHSFYGDFAQKSLIFQNDVKHPIEFFMGEPIDTSAGNSICSAHMLYMASRGELNNIHFDEIPSVPFASVLSAYSLLEKKLLFRKNKDFSISELGKHFVEQIYTPALEFSTGKRTCIRGLGFSTTYDVGQLYLSAYNLQKEYRLS